MLNELFFKDPKFCRMEIWLVVHFVETWALLTILLSVQLSNCIKRHKSCWFCIFNKIHTSFNLSKYCFAFVFSQMDEANVSCFIKSLEKILIFQKVKLDYVYRPLYTSQPFYTSIRNLSNYNNGLFTVRPAIKNITTIWDYFVLHLSDSKMLIMKAVSQRCSSK